MNLCKGGAAQNSADAGALTEHHNAVDNVTALTNLALLIGHVGHYGGGD